MPGKTAHRRLNIYLDDGTLAERIKVAAAREGLTLSAYCLGAVRRRLMDEGYLQAEPGKSRDAARGLDRLRRGVGPIGVPVSQLIAEGRR